MEDRFVRPSTCDPLAELLREVLAERDLGVSAVLRQRAGQVNMRHVSIKGQVLDTQAAQLLAAKPGVESRHVDERTLEPIALTPLPHLGRNMGLGKPLPLSSVDGQRLSQGA